MTYDPFRSTKGACGWAFVFMLAALVVFVLVDRESGWFLMAGAGVNVVMGYVLRGAGTVLEVDKHNG